MTETMAAVRRSITVQAGVQRAWDVYTAGYGSWYPKQHFIGDSPAQTVEFEPYAGGRWFERHADGTELLWGRVTAWEPPHRLLLAWMVGDSWKYDPDESRASEVEVTFTALDDGTTRVDLEHRGLERHGGAAAELHAGVSNDEVGHALYLRRFAAAVAGRPVEEA